MPHQRMITRVMPAVPVLVATILGLSACASEAVPQRSAAGLAAVTRPPALTVTTVPLPAGFDQPTTLVGDPSGAGVYFFAEDATNARVFHWDGHGLTSWSIGDPALDINLQTAAQNSIAVDKGSTVWVGVNSTLIDLNTATGTVTTTTMPAAIASAGAQKRRPPELAGYHAITGLAVAPDGDLAVTRDAAADVEVRNHTTGSFTPIVLASNTDPASIAYDANGDLAIGTNQFSAAGTTALGDGPLQLLTRGAVRMTTAKAGTNDAGDTLGGTVLSRPGGGFVQVPSTTNLTVAGVSSGGVKTPAQVLGSKAQLAVEGPVAAVTGDEVAVGTTSGLSLFNTTSRTEQDVTFPTFDCSDDSMTVAGTLNGPQANPRHGSCGERATAISVDATGTIWALTSGGNGAVAEIRK